jgi:hypothetical protein
MTLPSQVYIVTVLPSCRLAHLQTRILIIITIQYISLTRHSSWVFDLRQRGLKSNTRVSNRNRKTRNGNEGLYYRSEVNVYFLDELRLVEG